MSQPDVVPSQCEFCPDGHRAPGSKPMAVWVASHRDSDGQPTHLIVAYAAGEHVSEAEAQWLRDLIREADAEAAELAALRQHVAQLPPPTREELFHDG